MLYTSARLDQLRVPVSIVLGVLPPTLLFWSLWILTHTEAPPVTVTTYDVDYARQIVDSTLDVKPRDELVIPPVPAREDLPSLPPMGSAGEGTVIDPPPIYTPPGPDIRDGRLPPANNREPIPVIRINPEYPVTAMERNLEGWVKVQFTITASGSVKDARVVESSSRIFESAVLKAIERWRYNPMVVDGVGMDRVGVQTVLQFKLEN